jgi:hypothetical protein
MARTMAVLLQTSTKVSSSDQLRVALKLDVFSSPLVCYNLHSQWKPGKSSWSDSGLAPKLVTWLGHLLSTF